MSKATQKDLEALSGHPNAQEILEVLESPVEPWEETDRKKGYIVDYDLREDTVPCEREGIATVHRLKHWQNRDIQGLIEHIERQRIHRARWGLEFLERPNRKGPYATTGPSARKKVKEAYIEQHRAEWG